MRAPKTTILDKLLPMPCRPEQIEALTDRNDDAVEKVVRAAEGKGALSITLTK